MGSRRAAALPEVSLGDLDTQPVRGCGFDEALRSATGGVEPAWAGDVPDPGVAELEEMRERGRARLRLVDDDVPPAPGDAPVDEDVRHAVAADRPDQRVPGPRRGDHEAVDPACLHEAARGQVCLGRVDVLDEEDDEVTLERTLERSRMIRT